MFMAVQALFDWWQTGKSTSLDCVVAEQAIQFFHANVNPVRKSDRLFGACRYHRVQKVDVYQTTDEKDDCQDCESCSSG
jgi:hypothetical protein